MKRKKKNYKIYKQKRKLFLEQFKDIIKNNKNNLPKFTKNKLYEYEKIKTNSWFKI